jgi:hypothetical protein
MSGNSTIEILYRSTDKNKARVLVEALCDEFIAYDKEKKTESISNILNFLQDQINLYGNDFNVFQDSVKLMRIQSGFIQPSSNINPILGKIDEIDKKLIELEYANKSLGLLKNYVNTKNGMSYISNVLLDGEIARFSPEINQIAAKEREKRKATT